MTTQDKKQQTDARIMMPSPEVFEGQHAIKETVMAKGTRFLIFDRTEYPPEGGIYVHYKGVPFPKKGFPFPEAIWQNDIMKRILITFTKSIGTKGMALPILAFAILPWRIKIRNIENIIVNLNRTGEWILRSNFLKEERYSNACRELRGIVYIFLRNLGIADKPALDAAKIIASIFEYDDAYRYRLEDIASETTPKMLRKQPVREVRRLLKLFVRRELIHQRIRDTASSIGNLLAIALLHPRIRRAFRTAMDCADFSKLRLDEADKYHVLLRNDYDFTGRSFEERKKLYIKFHEDRSLPYPPDVELA